jgi:hypothetical protein
VQKRPQVVRHHLEAGSSQSPLGLLVGGLPGWEIVSEMRQGAPACEDLSRSVDRLESLARDGFT